MTYPLFSSNLLIPRLTDIHWQTHRRRRHQSWTRHFYCLLFSTRRCANSVPPRSHTGKVPICAQDCGNYDFRYRMSRNSSFMVRTAHESAHLGIRWPPVACMSNYTPLAGQTCQSHGAFPGPLLFLSLIWETRDVLLRAVRRSVDPLMTGPTGYPENL